MADNALHLNDEDKQALAISIADIVVQPDSKVRSLILYPEQI